MKRQNKISPAEGEFLFEIDAQPLEESITALGGVPLVVRALRSLDVPGSVKRNVVVKERDRGYDEATYVESLVVLNAVGGECLEDLEQLREDAGLAEMLGHAIPSAEAARKFLYQFHEQEKIEQAQRELPEGRVAYIPEESGPLQGLAQVNQDLVQELARRCPEHKIATIDMDTTIIESWKREAKPHYEGGTGYQPLLAVWAELNVVVADEFRDGNVPAHQSPLGVAQRAFAGLPQQVQEMYFRGDAACDEERLISWLRNPQREGGPQGFIGFAVSARMNEALHQAVLVKAEESWEPQSEDSRVIKECAEVVYVPEETPENRYREPLRYVAIRIRQKQQELFADGSRVKHFVVMSNRWELSPKKLLDWHREKAGTIEGVHDVIKNELAGGVMPCGRFGANAAWLRLSVLTYNALTALKRLALPPELITARPKRLRFLIFHTPGKLIHHARRTILRLLRSWNRFGNWHRALQLLPLPATD
jgi:hypothetical protein